MTLADSADVGVNDRRLGMRLLDRLGLHLQAGRLAVPGKRIAEHPRVGQAVVLVERGASDANGEKEIVFSKIRGLPVGVDGHRGMLPMAWRASLSATADVDHSVSSWVKLLSGAISIRNLTMPWSGPSTAVPIMLRTC